MELQSTRFHPSATIAFIGIIALGLILFFYPLRKAVPPGVDAAVYLNDAHWIADQRTIPRPGQLTYHGSTAYPSPVTAINLSIIQQITGWPLVFPTFSVYQALLIVLLLLSSYLVGTIYSRFVALLFPVAILGSFAVIRLFIGSTVANLLAFSLLNILFYLVHDYVQRKRQRNLLVIGLFLVALYFVHSYLTAPLFIPLFVVYFLVFVLATAAIRQSLWLAIRAWPSAVRIFLPLLLGGIALLLILYYIPVFREARYSFFLNQPASKFASIIPVSNYQSYLGDFLFIPGVLGLALYLFRFKENVLSYRILPLLWIVLLLILLQFYRFGIHFFYERLVFLGGVWLALFAAYAFDAVFAGRNRSLVTVGVALFMALNVVSGVTKGKTLYDKSNLITNDQIQALNLLRSASTPDDIVYSHINGVSETYHDVMVSDRDIIYFTTKAKNCPPADDRCLAFTTPEREASYDLFRKLRVNYFLFMKPSQEGNAVLDELISRYAANSHYRPLYRSSRATVFALNDKRP